MELPHKFWYKFIGYIKLQEFVNSTDVVNDCSERAVKLIKHSMEKAKTEEKLQHLLQVKNDWKKPVCRTEASYKESANSVPPTLKSITNEEIEVAVLQNCSVLCISLIFLKRNQGDKDLNPFYILFYLLALKKSENKKNSILTKSFMLSLC